MNPERYLQIATASLVVVILSSLYLALTELIQVLGKAFPPQDGGTSGRDVIWELVLTPSVIAAVIAIVFSVSFLASALVARLQVRKLLKNARRILRKGSALSHRQLQVIQHSYEQNTELLLNDKDLLQATLAQSRNLQFELQRLLGRILPDEIVRRLGARAKGRRYSEAGGEQEKRDRTIRGHCGLYAIL